MSATVLIEVYMVFLSYACRYHRRGQYAISGQTVLENQYTTFNHPVKNEAYMAHSVIAEEMKKLSEEKSDLLEKDE